MNRIVVPVPINFALKRLKMKKLLLVAVMSYSISAYSSHLLGGQLWYEHVSTSQNNVTLKVHLDLYRELSGITLGTTQIINVTCSIGGSSLSSTTQSLNLATPEYQLQSQNCGGSYTVMVNHFEGFITVPNNCSIKLSWETCCRPPGITGLNNSSAEGFYIEAKINLENPNVRSFDNSVVPPQLGIIRLNTGQINQVATLYSEIDGDSVFAALKPAKSNSTTNVNYATGYSFTQPIHSNSIHPFTLSSSFNGFSGLPTTNETSVISFRVDNYITDTVTNTPYRIGYITADLPVTVQSSAISSQPISISAYTIGNTIGQLLVLSDPVYSNSITQGLTEFELLYNSQPISNGITGYYSNTNQSGLLDTINLTFGTSITSGIYGLHHKIGSDNTLLVGQCAQSTTDTIISILVPFTNAQIIGDLNPYQSGYYKLSNANNIDSVQWSVKNGTLNNTNDSIVTLYPADSVFATLNSSQCELTALRFGLGIVDTLSIVVSPTGIGTFENSLNDLWVFPNPTEGHFHLFGELFGTYELQSIDGRILETGTIKKDYDLSNYSKGVYYLSLSTDKFSRVLKIVKN